MFLAGIHYEAASTAVLAGAAIIGAFVGAISWLIARGKRDQKLDELLKKVTPNGGDSEDIGDIAKRTENAVAEVQRRLSEHIDASLAVHRELRRDIDDITAAHEAHVGAHR